MIDFVSKKNWFFIASAVPIVVGIIFLAINGIPWGIDFTGGTVMTLEPVGAERLESELKGLGYEGVVIEASGDNSFNIQTATELTEEGKAKVQETLQALGLTVAFTDGTHIAVTGKAPITRSDLKAKLDGLGHSEATIQDAGENTFIVQMEELTDEEGDTIEKSLATTGTIISSSDEVSDPVAKEKARNAVIAVALASVGMLIYIWWAFRKVPKPFRYGTCAVIAMLHDVFICLAFFTVFADSLNVEINLMFVTGLLTVVGYSVNDTVVVFDRIRENIGKGARNVPFADVVNSSLTETLTRCLITVLTTLIACAAVYLFVGDAIRSFLMVLLVGIASGAYSSIFIASMLLVVWESWRSKKAVRGAAQTQNS